MQPFAGQAAPAEKVATAARPGAGEQCDGVLELRTTVEFLLTLAPVLRVLFRGTRDAMRSPSPLTPRQMQALCVICHEPSLSVSRLAARLGMALASASQIVAQLAALGVVRREEDPLDHRRTVVVPGPRFEEIFEDQVVAQLAPLRRALAGLEDDERAGLVRGLHRLSTLVGLVSSEHPDAHRCWREQAEGRINS